MDIFNQAGSSNHFMIPIDTLSIAKILKSAGTPSKQAEAHAKVLGELISHNLATKTDVEKLSNEIVEVKRDVAELKKDVAELKIEIVEVKKDIIRLESKIEASTVSILKWMIPLMFTQMGAIAGIVSWMLKALH